LPVAIVEALGAQLELDGAAGIRREEISEIPWPRPDAAPMTIRTGVASDRRVRAR
jgi:hypothetical protein